MNATHPNNLRESSSGSGSCQNLDDSTTANGVASSSDQETWSSVQEKALVQALKTFPKETGQRWERVAAAVPKKTVGQCKKKFKLMKDNFWNSNVPEKNTCKSDSSDPSSSPIENCQKANDSNFGNGVSSSSDQDIFSLIFIFSFGSVVFE
ncbi:dnaJ-like protein subfamily C member 2-like [Forsythia ovata]|uniref:DnaJ-like protein subfamily C member 2-like n=1 Tax=Forsythia ovata TaxID=205694 RepID=A0ABD1VMR1_9LAMI